MYKALQEKLEAEVKKEAALVAYAMEYGEDAIPLAQWVKPHEKILDGNLVEVEGYWRKGKPAQKLLGLLGNAPAPKPKKPKKVKGKKPKAVAPPADVTPKAADMMAALKDAVEEQPTPSEAVMTPPEVTPSPASGPEYWTQKFALEPVGATWLRTPVSTGATTTYEKLTYGYLAEAVPEWQATPLDGGPYTLTEAELVEQAVLDDANDDIVWTLGVHPVKEDLPIDSAHEWELILQDEPIGTSYERWKTFKGPPEKTEHQVYTKVSPDGWELSRDGVKAPGQATTLVDTVASHFAATNVKWQKVGVPSGQEWIPGTWEELAALPVESQLTSATMPTWIKVAKDQWVLEDAAPDPSFKSNVGMHQLLKLEAEEGTYRMLVLPSAQAQVAEVPAPPPTPHAPFPEPPGEVVVTEIPAEKVKPFEFGETDANTASKGLSEKGRAIVDAAIGYGAKLIASSSTTDVLEALAAPEWRIALQKIIDQQKPVEKKLSKNAKVKWSRERYRFEILMRAGALAERVVQGDLSTYDSEMAYLDDYLRDKSEAYGTKKAKGAGFPVYEYPTKAEYLLDALKKSGGVILYKAASAEFEEKYGHFVDDAPTSDLMDYAQGAGFKHAAGLEYDELRTWVKGKMGEPTHALKFEDLEKKAAVNIGMAAVMASAEKAVAKAKAQAQLPDVDPGVQKTEEYTFPFSIDGVTTSVPLMGSQVIKVNLIDPEEMALVSGPGPDATVLAIYGPDGIETDAQDWTWWSTPPDDIIDSWKVVAAHPSVDLGVGKPVEGALSPEQMAKMSRRDEIYRTMVRMYHIKTSAGVMTHKLFQSPNDSTWTSVDVNGVLGEGLSTEEALDILVGNPAWEAESSVPAKTPHSLEREEFLAHASAGEFGKSYIQWASERGGRYLPRMNEARRRMWGEFELTGNRIAQFELEHEAAIRPKGQGKHKGQLEHPGSPDSPAGKIAWQNLANLATVRPWGKPFKAGTSAKGWTDEELQTFAEDFVLLEGTEYSGLSAQDLVAQPATKKWLVNRTKKVLKFMPVKHLPPPSAGTPQPVDGTSPAFPTMKNPLPEKPSVVPQVDWDFAVSLEAVQYDDEALDILSPSTKGLTPPQIEAALQGTLPLAGYSTFATAPDSVKRVMLWIKAGSSADTKPPAYLISALRNLADSGRYDLPPPPGSWGAVKVDDTTYVLKPGDVVKVIPGAKGGWTGALMVLHNVDVYGVMSATRVGPEGLQEIDPSTKGGEIALEAAAGFETYVPSKPVSVPPIPLTLADAKAYGKNFHPVGWKVSGDFEKTDAEMGAAGVSSLMTLAELDKALEDHGASDVFVENAPSNAKRLYLASAQQLEGLKGTGPEYVLSTVDETNLQLVQILEFKARYGHYGFNSAKPALDPSKPYAKYVAKGLTSEADISAHWPPAATNSYVMDFGLTSQGYVAAPLIAAHLQGLMQVQKEKPTVGTKLVLTKMPKIPVQGGSHVKAGYKDQFLRDWFSKDFGHDPNAKYRIEAEAAANEIGRVLGFRGPETRAMEVDGKLVFLSSVKDPDAPSLTGKPLDKLSDQHLEEVTQEQLLDWLLSNHDTHDDNLMVGVDGHIFGVDKGQSFKFFPNDQLSWDYVPNAAYGENVVYNDLQKLIVSGAISKERADKFTLALLKRARRLEKRDDARYEALLEKAMASRDDFSLDGAGNPTGFSSRKEFIAALMERKRNLATHFEALYKKIYAAAGLEWTLPSLDTIGTGTFDSPTGPVYVGVSPSLLEAVEESGATGVAALFAGPDLEEGHILFEVHHQATGGKALVGTAKVRKQSGADDRLKSWVKEHTITSEVGGGSHEVLEQPGSTLPRSHEWANAIIAAAKTVRKHVTDGEYNAATLMNLEGAKQEMLAARQIVADFEEQHPKAVLTKSKLYPDAAVGHAWLSFVDKEQQEAWKASVQTYLKYVEEIQESHAKGVKTPSNSYAEVEYSPSPKPKILNEWQNPEGAKVQELDDNTWQLVYGDDETPNKKLTKAAAKKMLTQHTMAEGQEVLQQWVVKYPDQEGQFLIQKLADGRLAISGMVPAEYGVPGGGTQTISAGAADVAWEELTEGRDTTEVETPTLFTHADVLKNTVEGMPVKVFKRQNQVIPFTLNPDTMAKTQGQAVLPQASVELVAKTGGFMSTEERIRMYGEVVMSQGYQYDVDIGDGKILISYLPSGDPTIKKSQQGALRIAIRDWDGTEEDLHGVIDFLRDMGVDLTPADEESMQLTYWRSWTGMSRERASVPPKVKSVLDAIKKAYAQTPDMAPGEELDMLRGMWAAYLGQEKVDNAPWEPRFDHTYIPNTELATGRPYILRPDIDPIEFMESEMDKGGVTHNFVHKIQGTSPEEDQNVGGAAFAFAWTNIQPNYDHQTQTMFVANPAVLLRIPSFWLGGDSFGNQDAKLNGAPWDPHQILAPSGGQINVKHILSLFDTMEVWALTEHQRIQVLKVLKAAGITEIRGVPVEQRVISTAGNPIETKMAYKKALKASIAWYQARRAAGEVAMAGTPS